MLQFVAKVYQQFERKKSMCKVRGYKGEVILESNVKNIFGSYCCPFNVIPTIKGPIKSLAPSDQPFLALITRFE